MRRLLGGLAVVATLVLTAGSGGSASTPGGAGGTSATPANATRTNAVDLPPSYVIFARVTNGMDTVDTLAATPVGMGGDGGMSQPLTPVKIKKVTIRP